ncbi:fatty acid hydroxylase superfamily-domain-containing protein [Gongronella butleri]|nr:fatty acid hydroxylase superfamily-domain-containing protein [Gongronella butleri]
MNSVIEGLVSDLQRAFANPWKDEVLAMWLPVAVYWVYSLMYHFLMKAEIPFFEQFRLHDPQEGDKRNRVSVKRVLAMVAFQQITQMLLSILVLHPEQPDQVVAHREMALARYFAIALHLVRPVPMASHEHVAMLISRAMYYALIPAMQFFLAMVILDAHQYFLHRLFHMNKFLYKHFHSHHHRLYVPYAFGALYNHPLEGLLLDSLGAAMASEIMCMTPRMCIYFFTFSTLKTVDDHCGYAFPWNPLQFLFANNVEYHNVHHQPYGIKHNFSQPYFTFWDKLLGTEMQKPRASKAAKLNGKAQ